MSVSVDDLWPHWRAEWLVYEDDELLVIDKPAGMAMAATQDAEHDQARARLRAWLAARSPTGEQPQLGIMHPLDRQASGLVLLSKCQSANAPLAAQLAHGMARHYLVAIDEDGRRPHRASGRRGASSSTRGRRARRPWQQRLPRGVECTMLERRGRRSLLELRWSASSQPVRRTMARVGTPIAGDVAAGGAPAGRLMLHISRLRLVHPQHHTQLELSAPQPAAFARWLEGQPPPWDPPALERALRRAIDRRYRIGRRDDTNALRLVNSVADGLPGVVVDLYRDHCVVALNDELPATAREAVCAAVAELGVAGVYLKLRPRQSSELSPAERQQRAPSSPWLGEPAPDPLVIREAGLPYEVRLGDGMSTGVFVDQRHGRARVRQLSQGKRVLNLFAYAGAFTVAAVAGGAVETLSVDASRAALTRAAANLARIGAQPPAHSLLQGDAIAWLAAAERRDEPPFDLVILDPPSYATTKRHTFRSARDYQALACSALGRVAPGGALLACTNHRGTSPQRFAQVIEHAVRDSGRTLAHVERLPCPADHPPAPGEHCHLKSLLLELR